MDSDFGVWIMILDYDYGLWIVIMDYDLGFYVCFWMLCVCRSLGIIEAC